MNILVMQNATIEIELNKTMMPPINFANTLNTIEKKFPNAFPVLLMPCLVFSVIF